MEEDLVLGKLQTTRAKERKRYRRFVEERLLREVENPSELSNWQAVLGSKSFAPKRKIGSNGSKFLLQRDVFPTSRHIWTDLRHQLTE